MRRHPPRPMFSPGARPNRRSARSRGRQAGVPERAVPPVAGSALQRREGDAIRHLWAAAGALASVSHNEQDVRVSVMELGRVLEYETAGRGDSVLFIHGAII